MTTTTTTTELSRDEEQAEADRKVRMTDAMREGLDALEREYAAFVESSFETLSLITDRRTRRR
jgi:hypothetical protein